MVKSSDYKIKEDNIRSNSKIIIPNNAEDGYMFHYTSIDGLKSILKDKKLWFSHVAYMNDANEIKDGVQIMLKRMKESNQESEELIIAMEQYSNKALIDILDKHIFVCCFSLSGDELPLWNYYTKSDIHYGYNIGFSNKGLLETLILYNLKSLNGCSISFGDVIYNDEQKAEYFNGYINSFIQNYTGLTEQAFKIFLDILIQKFRSNIEKSDEEIEKTKKEEVDKFILEAMNKEFILPPIYQFNGDKLVFEGGPLTDPIVFFKNKNFQSEKEIRIVITIPDDKIEELKEKGIYKFRNSNGIFIPYLELEFDKQSIQGIKMAPTVKSDLAERSIKDYCKYCNLDIENLELGISKSSVPVRY